MIAVEQEHEQAVLRIAGRPIGGPHFAMIAGPCTVESREQVLDAAQPVSDILKEGNESVILCERGIRTFDDTRLTL
jgi:3-deoxy-D-arabino-heptulosonate 7-phosphate (DAHP) synthase